MQRGRDSELIFLIKDAASAALMVIKADCLHTAGIINEAEKQYVHSRARTFLDGGRFEVILEQSRSRAETECFFDPELTMNCAARLDFRCKSDRQGKLAAFTSAPE
jgi:hypothetical protein